MHILQVFFEFFIHWLSVIILLVITFIVIKKVITLLVIIMNIIKRVIEKSHTIIYY